MSRSGAYGQSFAMKFLETGELDKALVEADKEVARDPEDPEAMLDRAQVHLALARYEGAVADLVRARELDADSPILDDSLVDDTLFTALVDWGKSLAAASPDRAVATIERYGELLPGGRHAAEVPTWARRFRGVNEMWVKPH